MANNKKVKSLVNGLTMEERFPRNIPQALFDSWQLCRKKNDAKLIAEKFNICRPIVDRALKYGHVKNERLQINISKFFAGRYDKDAQVGDKLIKAVIKP